MNDKVDKKQFEQDFKKRKLKGIKVLAEKKNDILYEVHLGEIIVKQNQFDILLAEINKINNKVDEMNSDFNKKIDGINKKMDDGFSKVNHRLDNVETRLDKIEADVSGLKKDVSMLKKDVSEIKIVLKKHDDAMVEHGWFNKPSFE